MRNYGSEVWFLMKKAPMIIKTIKVIIFAAAEILLTIFTQDLPKKLITENNKIKKIILPI